MTRLTLILLCLLSACTVNTARHVHTLPSRGQFRASKVNLIRVTGTVYLRDKSGVTDGRGLSIGAIVQADCIDDWCELSNGLSVWRGCTSNNPKGLGCEAR